MNDARSPMKPPPHPPATQSAHSYETPTARLISWGTFLSAAILVALSWHQVEAVLSSQAIELIFWAALAFVISLFPVAVGDFRLTLDLPVLLAAAVLFPPPAAALVAFVGSVDTRELRRAVTISHAVFNRSQIALSVFAGGLIFHVSPYFPSDWFSGIVITAGAVFAEYLANVVLVSIHARSLGRGSFRALLARLRVGSWSQFLLVYLAYGALALILARLFHDVGAWSVVAFLVPIMVARQALTRAQTLESLTAEMAARERLLERLFDRMSDERRDERSRIAAELHDDTLQALVRLWLAGKTLERQVGEARRPAAADITELLALSEASLESLRCVIHDLQESPLGRGGLLSSLRSLLAEFRLDWKVSIESELPRHLDADPGAQLVIYQLAREALLNALKHSGASEIRLKLHDNAGVAMLAVEDMGRGFDLNKVDDSRHFGLGLARERARLQGGSLQIESEPGKGTRLLARIPLQEPRDPDSTTSDRRWIGGAEAKRVSG